MRHWRMSHLVLIGLLSVRSLIAQTPTCASPDAAYISDWLARPEPTGEFGAAASDLITILRPPSTELRRLSAESVGAYRVHLMLAWRPDSIALVDSMYFSLHVPGRAEATTLQRAYALASRPVLTGYAWGSRFARTSDLSPLMPRRVVGEVAVDGTLAFGIDRGPYCEDCGNFSIVRQEAWGLSGWWGPSGAVVPESRGGFCAYRLEPTP